MAKKYKQTWVPETRSFARSEPRSKTRTFFNFSVIDFDIFNRSD